MNSSAVIFGSGGPSSPVDDEVLYEVVNGRIVVPPPMGAFEACLASRIQGLMGQFVRQHGLGRAVAQMLFVLNAGQGLCRRPDVAYVPYERWPRNRRLPRTEAWNAVPDPAI